MNISNCYPPKFELKPIVMALALAISASAMLASANERYLADTYVFTGPDGTVENKAQAIADLKSGDLKLQSASLDGAKVQVYGDTAVVTYSSNDKGTYKGKDITGKTRWTDVFVNHNGRWQVVASHGSMVPK